MPDYSKCVIYKIVCKDKNIKDCYVGSTCNHSRRKAQHKSDCNNEKSKGYNYNVYKFIRDNGNWDNWEFVIIEKYPVKDKIEKGIRERYWVELMGTLNSDIPSRTKKEYYENNKEYQKEYNKEYYENNKDKIVEYQKEYQKEYYKNNKDKAKEKNKEMYEKNKDRILNKNKQPYTCLSCNITMNKSSKTPHEKTKKHLQNLENII